MAEAHGPYQASEWNGWCFHSRFKDCACEKTKVYDGSGLAGVDGLVLMDVESGSVRHSTDDHDDLEVGNSIEGLTEGLLRSQNGFICATDPLLGILNINAPTSSLIVI